MQNDTIKRFERVVAIFIQLQSRRIVKAQDLASRFEVSLRTIYRDIKTLEASGIPIYSEAGIGYSLLEDYRLPPMSLTPEETASLVAAEKLMQKFTDKNIQQHFSSAMFKLKAGLKSNDQDRLSTIESQVVMQPLSMKFNEQVPNALEILFSSIARKTQVTLLYQAMEADRPTKRVIEPVGVFHQDNYWYVIGYCHLRQDYRQFRIDRIQQIDQTDQRFEKRHESLDYYLQRKDQRPTTRIVIEAPKQAVKYLRWNRHYFGFVEEIEEEEHVRMIFDALEPEHGFVRWFMMFSDQARIVEPLHIREKVREIARDTLEKGNPAGSCSDFSK